MERVREALAEHDCRPRGSHLSLRARCPAHGSKGPTLSVKQGRRGALITCFAGCELPDILAAIGLAWDDVFDQPREAKDHPWRPPKRKLSGPDAVAAVVAKVVRRSLDDDAARRNGTHRLLLPRLTPAQRAAWAVWAGREEAYGHYLRHLARIAELACDRLYIATAQADRAAWQNRQGPRPTHEQFLVLATWEADRARYVA